MYNAGVTGNEGCTSYYCWYRTYEVYIWYKRNITVIQGDSAIGKTTLIDYFSLFTLRGEKSGVRVESDVKCVVFSGSSDLWKNVLDGINSSIVFIDEDYDFIFTKQFAEYIKDSSNYYVLITWRPLYYLPYSINEIYGIRTSRKYHFPEKVYQELYPIYDKDVLDHPEDYIKNSEYYSWERFFTMLLEKATSQDEYKKYKQEWYH